MEDKNKIPELKIHDNKVDIKKTMEQNELIVCRSIIQRISYAIDNNLDKVAIMRLIFPQYVVTLSSEKDSFKGALTSNMEKLIKHEDYETCAIAKKYIEKI